VLVGESQMPGQQGLHIFGARIVDRDEDAIHCAGWYRPGGCVPGELMTSGE
jgi:hypothetical protein